jgi:hypothetical protein
MVMILNLYSSSFAPNNESHFPKHICGLYRENRKRESYFPSKGNWVPHICAPQQESFGEKPYQNSYLFC